ncbi:MAG: hypothetical protein PVJ57_13095 [Phycisphaerae bacterium]|jgi:hypothetical protein
MRYVSPHWWPAALAAYALAGLALGAAHAGWPIHTGIGESVVWNLYVLLPAASVTISLRYPRGWTTVVGTLGASMAWSWAYAHFCPPGPFVAMFLVFLVPAGWVLQCIFCVLAMLIMEDSRKVGRPPEPHRCRGCGYLLIGLTEPRCPECGRVCTLPAETVLSDEAVDAGDGGR